MGHLGSLELDSIERQLWRVTFTLIWVGHTGRGGWTASRAPRYCPRGGRTSARCRYRWHVRLRLAAAARLDQFGECGASPALVLPPATPAAREAEANARRDAGSRDAGALGGARRATRAGNKASRASTTSFSGLRF